MSIPKLKQLQQALKALGYNPGPIDGIRGKLTIGAAKAFVDGNAVASPKQSSTNKQSSSATYPWFKEAQRLSGTLEKRGKGSNPKITGWAKRMRIWYPHDGIAWCGLFVGNCISSKLPNEPLPKNVLGARNWLKFGKSVKPQMGAVMVFWRGSKNGWKGHVGFYAGEDKNAYHILGGNQSDAVNIRRVAKSRFLGARWPSTSLPPTGEKRFTDAKGRLSKNEA